MYPQKGEKWVNQICFPIIKHPKLSSIYQTVFFEQLAKAISHKSNARS